MSFKSISKNETKYTLFEFFSNPEKNVISSLGFFDRIEHCLGGLQTQLYKAQLLTDIKGKLFISHPYFFIVDEKDYPNSLDFESFLEEDENYLLEIYNNSETKILIKYDLQIKLLET